MLQNRLYFIFTARQLNAIRGFLLERGVPEFKKNQLYISTDVSAIKPFSMHTFQVIGSAIISSMFSAAAVYASLPIMNVKPKMSWPLLAFVLVALVEIYYGYNYLRKRSKMTADKAIHGVS
jgi:hypothetical protein